VLFLKDSLEITQNNRALILSKCLESEEDFILITHGTDTMVETAQLLGANIQNKTIVLRLNRTLNQHRKYHNSRNNQNNKCC
jgi:L-asparaginase